MQVLIIGAVMRASVLPSASVSLILGLRSGWWLPTATLTTVSAACLSISAAR